MNMSKQLIQEYYNSFNEGDLNKFMSFLHEEIAHDINHTGREIGKEKFLIFMKRMNDCYQETIKNLIIMTDEDGQHAAAEFVVEGMYKKTDSGLPPAQGQTYTLSGGAFFEIKDNKIIRVTNYYNLNDWLKQINK